ncbi:hypothetical protein EVAR_11575_1 [Eumeta japonica]|uniref:Uncharacterized protein n=1 Tax=Eumeta variegata TaxID=151549 RepID=A0A4C1X7Q1_EUMVA|nr:hypothetical protein EVAR_11575_1 [Eumeta japonica]
MNITIYEIIVSSVTKQKFKYCTLEATANTQLKYEPGDTRPHLAHTPPPAPPAPAARSNVASFKQNWRLLRPPEPPRRAGLARSGFAGRSANYERQPTGRPQATRAAAAASARLTNTIRETEPRCPSPPRAGGAARAVHPPARRRTSSASLHLNERRAHRGPLETPELTRQTRVYAFCTPRNLRRRRVFAPAGFRPLMYARLSETRIFGTGSWKKATARDPNSFNSSRFAA